MTTSSPPLSLVIPSTPNECEYLPGILEAYASGDEKPDEVIVTMSNAHQIWRSELTALERQGNALFDGFRLLRHNRRMTHGPNRQSAVEHCSHDVISFFDSDDLPYPGRVALLKQVFEDPDIVHANHCFTFLGEPLESAAYSSPPILADAEKLYRTYFPNGAFLDCRSVTGAYGADLGIEYTSKNFSGVAAGHATVRKSVFERVRWLDWRDLHKGFTEDYQFNMECLYTFRQSVIINLALTQYRHGHKTRNSFKRFSRRAYRAVIGLSNSVRP